MKYILYLLLGFTLLLGCDKDEPLQLEPVIVPPDPEPEVALIDSVHLNLLDLPVPEGMNEFIVHGFTARVPGFIWGSTSRKVDRQDDRGIFSYDLATDRVDYFSLPPDLGVFYLRQVLAGTDGKLYIEADGGTGNTVLVYDIPTGEWSAIEVPGSVSDIAVDEATNTLWIAHRMGVSTYRNGELYTYDETNSALQRRESGGHMLFGHSVLVDKSGTPWYVIISDLYSFENGEWTLHPLSPLSDRYNLFHVVPGEQEGLLVRLPDEALIRLNEESVTARYDLLPETVSSQLSALDILDRPSDSTIIYSHHNGLSYYDIAQDSIIQIDHRNSLLPDSQMMLRMDRDPDGRIWFGGYGVLGTLPDAW